MKPTYEELVQRLRILEKAESDLKSAREREAHIRNVLMAIRSVNQLLVKETDLEKIIKGVCDRLIETRGYYNAWIAIMDEDGSSVSTTAAAGFGSGLGVMRSRLLSGEIPSCMRKALDADSVMVTRNPPEECHDCPLSSEYADRSVLSHRLSYRGRIFGILSVSVPGAYAYDRDAHDLFAELAKNLGFTLSKLKTDAQRHRLQQIVTSIPQPISFVSQEYRYLSVNDVYADLFGIPAENIIGQKPSDFFGEQVFHEQIKPQLDQALRGTPIRYEIQTDFPGVGKRWMSMSYFPYRNEDGDITGVISHGDDITERKRAEDALRRNEKDLRESQRIAHVGSWRLDVATNQVVWTEELYNMYGFDPSLPPPPYTEHMKLFTPESWERLSTALARTRETRVPYTLELETVRKDGSNGWMWVRGEAEVDSAGKTVELWGAAQDITERKRAEKALLERLSYEQLLSRVSVLAMETDDLHIFQNKCLKAMGGTLDVSRIYIFEHHHETDTMDNTFEWVAEGVSPQKDELQGVSAADAPWWMKVLKSNQVINFADIEDIPDEGTKTILRPQRILSLLVVPLFTSGQYYGFLGFDDCVRHREWSDTDVELLKAVGRIMTGAIVQKRTEETLKESEELLDVTGFIARLGGWQLDVETMAVTWTKETYHIHEVPLNYKPPLDMAIEFFHPDDRDVLSQAIQRAIDQCEPYDMELRFITAKGNNLWTRTTCQPEVVGGKTVRLRGTFQDITKRKQAEAEREKLQAQLAQAQKMESVGRLAGGVAHDFNNMLGVILGHTEMALEQVAHTEPLRADLEEIQKAAQRSADITRQLLAFARKQTIAPKVIDLNKTVNSALKMIKRLIGEDIDLVWVPEGENLWPVKIDPFQIDQILTNLCVNARDAISDMGKITVETGNASFDAAYCADHPGFVPGDFALLAVSDDGCGMDKQALANLFEPFFTTKAVDKGTGLGLATVYGIVKQNDGFVNVYSEPGQGTTFKIYLPRHAAKTARDTEKHPPQAFVRGRETILLVEDEPSILRMTRMMLERIGYKVLAAGTPGEAMALAREHVGEIHLLMTDVVMPEMNGRDLARNLLSLYPNIKRLFMSGYTANVIAHHGVLEPGVQFIQKPFAKDKLATKVREALEES